MSERKPRVRRAREATESLLSIVLLLEAVLVFFVTLVAYGLKVVPPGVAFGGANPTEFALVARLTLFVC